MINKTQKNRVIYYKIAEKIALDSIVDHVLTRLIGITMKNYIYAEISSQMENQLCEYVSFGGVCCPVLQLLNIDLPMYLSKI